MAEIKALDASGALRARLTLTQYVWMADAHGKRIGAEEKVF